MQVEAYPHGLAPVLLPQKLRPVSRESTASPAPRAKAKARAQTMPGATTATAGSRCQANRVNGMADASAIPFTRFAWQRDPAVAVVAPGIVCARAFAFALGAGLAVLSRLTGRSFCGKRTGAKPCG